MIDSNFNLENFEKLFSQPIHARQDFNGNFHQDF
jgi:hypothetical protein